MTPTSWTAETAWIPGRHRVAVLALDGVMPFDLGVPVQVFGSARAETDDGTGGEQLYDVRVCGADGLAPVATSGGFTLTPSHGPDLLAEAHTVIVPGIERRSRIVEGQLTDAEAAALRVRPARLMSICTGAFALAAAGVLDGRPATTHWAYTELFRRQFPTVRLDPDVLFIDDGDVLTSAGVAAGIDLCLHVIRGDHGSAVANDAARRCVVAPWRDGGQSQFIPRPVTPATDASTGPARAWALRHLDSPLDLSTMARRARMSVRTFTRRFREETGQSPGQWLARQRVERARLLLETTDLAVDEIARRCGFGTGVSLRTHLHAHLGVAPSTYRRTFSARGASVSTGTPRT
jgi:transcriptional regulator GlxA family with amidase domain